MSEGNDILEFFKQYQEQVNGKSLTPLSDLRVLVRDVCLKLKAQGASCEIAMIFAEQVIVGASKEGITDTSYTKEYIDMVNKIYLQVYKEEWEKIENDISES